MWDFVLDVLFPRSCLSCGKFGSFFCPHCQQLVVKYTTALCPYCQRPSRFGLTHQKCQPKNGLDGLFVWAHYRGPIPQLVHVVKYEGVYGVLGELATLMAKDYGGVFTFDYLIPIPLATKRLRDREFNQAEVLAKKLQPLLNSPVASLLKRTRETKPQFDLGYQARRKNLANAFALDTSLFVTPVSPYPLAGGSFCLIDDVVTTGTTLFECARVLKQAGANKVYAIAIARGG